MSEQPIRREELEETFRGYEKPPEQFRIGAENEKFGVHEETGAPLNYGGDFSVCKVFTSLEDDYSWTPVRETPEGPVLGLSRGAANITLEPSVQFELSGEPLSDLHLIREEQETHLRELLPISRQMGIAWLGTGFHPFCRLDELSWVPKRRYPIMRDYLPKMGKGGLDMMQRTATVQGNFDWSSEADAMKKFIVALKLSPLIQAWFSNAPFSEKRDHGALSRRGDVWRNMDPFRSGLLGHLWPKTELSYDDYVEWSLDAGIFLFVRDGVPYLNTGQTFRDFLAHGFDGKRATRADFKLHLQTLFPEVRLKNTLEVRSVDSLPPDLALASLAVWTGVLYDQQALDEAQAVLSEWTYDQVENARAELIERGLHAPLVFRDGFYWAERILAIAHSGLSRRARDDAEGRDEAHYLKPAEEILTTRKLPAEQALARYRASGSLVQATRIPMGESLS